MCWCLKAGRRTFPVTTFQRTSASRRSVPRPARPTDGLRMPPSRLGCNASSRMAIGSSRLHLPPSMERFSAIAGKPTVRSVRSSTNTIRSRRMRGPHARSIARRLRSFNAGSGSSGERVRLCRWESVFARFQRFVERPTREEARFFGDMVHVSGFGTTTETGAIASPPPLRDFLKRPRTLVDAYRDSHWQLAFLQRVIGSNSVAASLLRLRAIIRSCRIVVKQQLQRRRLSSNAHS